MRVYYFRCYWHLAIELTLCCQMCDIHFKIWGGSGKICRLLSRTIGILDRQRVIHSSDFVSVQCHALHWTDNDSTLAKVIWLISMKLYMDYEFLPLAVTCHNFRRLSQSRMHDAWNCVMDGVANHDQTAVESSQMV